MIPKVIHQAWFGPPMPQRLIDYSETFTKHNPEWELRLWRPYDITSDSAFTRVVLTIYHSNVLPPVVKSDIFRYSVIYQYGGFWADTDCECLKPLDPIMDCNFACGMESDEHVGSAFFGAIPAHPLVKSILDGAMENLGSVKTLSQLTPSWIMDNIGIRHFSRHVCAFQYENGNIMINKREYFFPVDWNKKGVVTPLSFINHHFAGAEPGGWTKQ